MYRIILLALCGGLFASACTTMGPTAPVLPEDQPHRVRVFAGNYAAEFAGVVVSWGTCDHSNVLVPGTEFLWPPEGAERLRFCVGYVLPLRRTDLGTFHASGILKPDSLERAVADSAMFFFRREDAPLSVLTATVVGGIFSASRDYTPAEHAELVIFWPVDCSHPTDLEDLELLEGLRVHEVTLQEGGIITIYAGLPNIKLECLAP